MPATNQTESNRRASRPKQNAASNASASAAKIAQDAQCELWNVRTARLGRATVLMGCSYEPGRGQAAREPTSGIAGSASDSAATGVRARWRGETPTPGRSA